MTPSPTPTPGKSFKASRRLMTAALAASLAGDVFLMFPGQFIAGLVSFLLAHLCYLAVFRQDLAWFPHRGALTATLAVGAGMYAFLWSNGLPAALRGPVAAYVLVIAFMAAQAIGRASVVGGRGAWMVAAGAAFFMLSDSLLATNRFARDLPMASFWVLSTYYAAQVLIVWGWLQEHAATAAPPSTGNGTPQDGPAEELAGLY